MKTEQWLETRELMLALSKAFVGGVPLWSLSWKWLQSPSDF